MMILLSEKSATFRKPTKLIFAFMLTSAVVPAVRAVPTRETGASSNRMLRLEYDGVVVGGGGRDRDLRASRSEDEAASEWHATSASQLRPLPPAAAAGSKRIKSSMGRGHEDSASVHELQETTTIRKRRRARDRGSPKKARKLFAAIERKKKSGNGETETPPVTPPTAGLSSFSSATVVRPVAPSATAPTAPSAPRNNIVETIENADGGTTILIRRNRTTTNILPSGVKNSTTESVEVQIEQNNKHAGGQKSTAGAGSGTGGPAAAATGKTGTEEPDPDSRPPGERDAIIEVQPTSQSEGTKSESKKTGTSPPAGKCVPHLPTATNPTALPSTPTDSDCVAFLGVDDAVWVPAYCAGISGATELLTTCRTDALTTGDSWQSTCESEASCRVYNTGGKCAAPPSSNNCGDQQQQFTHCTSSDITCVLDFADGSCGPRFPAVCDGTDATACEGETNCLWRAPCSTGDEKEVCSRARGISSPVFGAAQGVEQTVPFKEGNNLWCSNKTCTISDARPCCDGFPNVYPLNHECRTGEGMLQADAYCDKEELEENGNIEEITDATNGTDGFCRFTVAGTEGMYICFGDTARVAPSIQSLSGLQELVERLIIDPLDPSCVNPDGYILYGVLGFLVLCIIVSKCKKRGAGAAGTSALTGRLAQLERERAAETARLEEREKQKEETEKKEQLQRQRAEAAANPGGGLLGWIL
mmetsp:Transcript_18250/g.45627  ORF Transcript_18250/g.45627 Transcript_18250/m.45627 type:complete len:703 (+) Transcript_18250:144-2252(+)